MLRFIRCIIWVLGATVMVPATSPAGCPFPLPSALKVGQRWTYLLIAKDLEVGRTPILDSDAILDIRTHIQTISVVSHRQIEDRTYFVLRYNDFQGLYRVDDCRRTWWYNADNGTEVLCWDIWGLLDYSATVVFAGEPARFYDLEFERWGPLDLHDSSSSFGLYPDSTYSAYGVPDEGAWLENLLAWEATSPYQFLVSIGEVGYNTVIDPDVGVLLEYARSWETAWTSILLSYEPGENEPIDTHVEDVSFGEIKERVRRLKKRQP